LPAPRLKSVLAQEGGELALPAFPFVPTIHVRFHPLTHYVSRLTVYDLRITHHASSTRSTPPADPEIPAQVLHHIRPGKQHHLLDLDVGHHAGGHPVLDRAYRHFQARGQLSFV